MIKRKLKNFLRVIIFFLIRNLKILPSEINFISKIKLRDIEINFKANNDITRRRWLAFERTGKEINTLNWIDNFEENSIFYDIGANVGVFSVYAALKKRAKVYAFEPEPNSFIELVKTTEINQVNIVPMMVPLSDKFEFNFFNLKNRFEAGKSRHYFGNKNDQKFSFGICSTSIDNMIEEKKIPSPNYIKIDVDGLEARIINGLQNLLEEKSLISILIEFMHDKERIFYTDLLKKKSFFLIEGPSGNNRNYIYKRVL